MWPARHSESLVSLRLSLARARDRRQCSPASPSHRWFQYPSHGPSLRRWARGGRSWILTGSLRLRVRLSPASFDSGPRRRSAPSHSPSPGGRGGQLVPTRSRFAGTALASDCSRRPPCPTPPSREPAGCPAARPPPFNQCNTDQRIIEFTAAIMIAAGAAAQSLLIPRRIESRRRRQSATCASSFLPSFLNEGL